jgi:hypothetical protein
MRAWSPIAVGALVAMVPLDAQAEQTWAESKPGYTQIFATAFVGDGLRFNNPYRLATPLGSDAESVSRTASYVDIGAAMTFGDPLGFQHGAALRLTSALEGISQQVFTPAYLLWRRWRAFAAYARAGIPIVLRPNATWGGEAGIGGVWFFRGGIGVAGEIVGDIFYGAGTRETAVPAYPMLSGQLGIVVAYEVLP